MKIYPTAFVVLSLVASAQADEWVVPSQVRTSTPDVPPAAATRALQNGVLTLRLAAVEIVNIDQDANTVILGEPKIADASVIGGRTIAVTAKTVGVTSMIVLDRDNKEILRTVVRVQPVGRPIQVMHGDKPQVFSCDVSCEALSAPPPSTTWGTVTENRDGQGNLTGTTVSNTTLTRQSGGVAMPPGPPPIR